MTSPSRPWVPDDGRIWHEYDGSGMPCPGDASVVVLLRLHREVRHLRGAPRPAECWVWRHFNDDDDIVAWAYDDPTDEPTQAADAFNAAARAAAARELAKPRGPYRPKGDLTFAGVMRALAKIVTPRRDDVRGAFEAGYRMGYGNGHHDSECGEPFSDDPGDAFELWLAGDDAGGPF